MISMEMVCPRASVSVGPSLSHFRTTFLKGIGRHRIYVGQFWLVYNWIVGNADVGGIIAICTPPRRTTLFSCLGEIDGTAGAFIPPLRGRSGFDNVSPPRRKTRFSFRSAMNRRCKA